MGVLLQTVKQIIEWVEVLKSHSIFRERSEEELLDCDSGFRAGAAI